MLMTVQVKKVNLRVTNVDSDDTSSMLDGVKNGNQSSNRNEDGSKEGSSELPPTEEGVIPHQFQL